MSTTRRDFLKKAGYVAPAVMTMTTLPAIASNGSEHIETGESAFTQPERWQSRERRNMLRRLERELDGLESGSGDHWQSRARRNRLRRLEERGINIRRFSNWENIDPRLIG